MKSILILDDDTDLSDKISELAHEHFEKVYVCTEGSHALDILKDHEISIVLSDYSMPKMTGEMFLKKMRSQGFENPLVFLTGNANKDLAISALKLGASDFLEKPFQSEHLMQTLRLAVEIEQHKKKLGRLEHNPQNKAEVIQHEKKALAIKRAFRVMKKPAS